LVLRGFDGGFGGGLGGGFLWICGLSGFLFCGLGGGFVGGGCGGGGGVLGGGRLVLWGWGFFGVFCWGVFFW